MDVFREIAGGNADIPFGVFPFGVFVVGEGASGDGVNGLAFEFEVAGLMEELEDVGFAGTCGGADDDVGAGAEVIDGLMLPEIGEFELVERGEHLGAGRIKQGDVIRKGVSGEWFVRAR